MIALPYVRLGQQGMWWYHHSAKSMSYRGEYAWLPENPSVNEDVYGDPIPCMNDNDKQRKRIKLEIRRDFSEAHPSGKERGLGESICRVLEFKPK